MSSSPRMATFSPFIDFLPRRETPVGLLPGGVLEIRLSTFTTGLLMNSEIWVCLTEEDRALPFVLVEQGYDVWLGNNRLKQTSGNKYSKKSIHHRPDSIAFWDFGIDDFAWHDIPDSINYILDITKVEQLSYVGFSQGTAQAFAAFSINPQLNRKINVFIALAPALSPPGLSASIVDALMKASPTLVYLVFGRRAILSSALTWQSILYPPIFSSLIDGSLTWLFNWKSKNISQSQKIAAYAHLYSFTSVKAVVHWSRFQILRSSTFVMYDDEVAWFNMQRAQHNSFVDTNEKISRKHGVTSYCPARFPTENIVTPIVLIVLPRQTVVKRLHGYEHLDVLWGKGLALLASQMPLVNLFADVDKDVIPHVLGILGQYSGRTDFGKFHEMRKARMLSNEKIADTSNESE
ncbi:Alpha/Beta hydrolase protein [Flagelloscypha sp. PMI_526]|nr:Alpha/Beta hydrolase protein [Flagelloscypha sp. PMI_526]